MLAVKLHRKKKPFLGKNSFLIPIITWQSSRGLIRSWIKVLNNSNRGNPNHHINYITLVQIPDDHPVYLAEDWGIKSFEDDLKFEPLYAIDQEFKEAIREVSEEGIFMPEVILVAPLPENAVKWTKDIKSLYRRAQSADHGEEQP